MTSTRRQTAQRQVDAWNRWSLDDILADRADGCIHQVLPKTLGTPAMDNAAYRQHLETNVLPNYRNFKIEVDDMIEDEKQNKMVVMGHTSADTDIGVFENQYIFAIYFNEDGTKFEKFLEYVDATKMTEFITKLRAAKA